MAPIERNPYFVYYEGVDPSLLPLHGTFLSDYANPKTTRRPYRQTGDSDLLESPAMATEDQRTFCNILWSQHTDAMFNVDLKKIVNISHKRTGSDLRLVVGKPGSKLELIDSDKFFEENLMKKPEVLKWFTTRLSVTNSMSKARAVVHNVVDAPDVWLLTGVYIIEDATVYSVRKTSSSTKAGAKIPVSDPTGLTDLAGMKVGLTFSLGDGIEAQASTRIEGRRVWAARWQKIKARYVAAAKVNTGNVQVEGRIKLLDVWSVGTERGGEEENPLVEIKLGEGIGETSDELDMKAFDEAWWNKFETNLDDLLEELEE